MIFNLMAGNAGTWILMIALVAVLVVFMIYNRKAQTKRQKETMEMLNAIKPGNKVKTIGGICGVVVEVCAEDNTFVLETGTEASGKSYIKFDKQAVYQTDAVVEKAEVKPVEEASEPVEEAKAETQEPTEETKDNE